MTLERKDLLGIEVPPMEPSRFQIIGREIVGRQASYLLRASHVDLVPRVVHGLEEYPGTDCLGSVEFSLPLYARGQKQHRCGTCGESVVVDQGAVLVETRLIDEEIKLTRAGRTRLLQP